MSKSAKEKAKEWNCHESTVKGYCRDGLIPPATKSGPRRSWQIPEEWPKPPLGRQGLCFLLDTIYQLKHGAVYETLSLGYPEDMVLEGYRYLIMSGFMSNIDVDDLAVQLKNAEVTPRGEALIIKHNSKDGTASKAYTVAKVNLGIVNFETGVSRE